MRLALFLFSVLITLASASSYEWQASTDLPVATSDLAATAVTDGILISGGCIAPQICESDAGDNCACPLITANVYRFLPGSGTDGTFIRGESMPIARFRHKAVYAGGQVYIIGGRDVDDNIIAQVDVYDPDLDSWLPGVPLPAEYLVSDAAAFEIDDVIYVSGGYDQGYTAQSRTIRFNVNTPAAGWVLDAPLETPRGDLCAAASDNSAYLFGGYGSDFCNPLDQPEQFTPDEGWVGITDLVEATGRGDKACTFAKDRFWIIGGETKRKRPDGSCFSSPISDVESYEPLSANWASETSIDVGGPRMRFAAAAYNDDIFTFGGQTALSGNLHPVVATVEVLVLVEDIEETVQLGFFAYSGIGLASTFFACVIILAVAFAACPERSRHDEDAEGMESEMPSERIQLEEI